MNGLKRSILLLAILCLLSGCKNNKTDRLLINGYEIDITKSESCNNKKFYLTVNGKSIYLKCIDDVIFKKDENNITLKEYLQNSDFSTFVKELENQVKPQVYKDGGTKIYKKNDVTIVICKKIIGADNYFEDIYFGNDELTYDNTCSQD